MEADTPVTKRGVRPVKTGRTYLQLSGLAVVAVLLFGVLRSAHAAPQETNAATSQKQTAQYVGVDTCKTCHEELYKGFESTAHFRTTLHDGHGCESCHGPGSAHVEGGGDVTKIISFT